MKIVSSCYLDSSSRGTFTYCKARLIRNELLEKEVGSSGLCSLCCRAPDCCVSPAVELLHQFIEKRREMKQEGRTEQELSESFCFLYPDKSKVLSKAEISLSQLCRCHILKFCFSSGVCSSSGSVKRVWPLDILG